MIRSCLMSRKELINMIKAAPKTKDGHFFFPRFKALVTLPGNIKDNGFYYDRYLFCTKTCFDEFDLKLFTAKKKMNYDIDLKRFIDNKINEAIEGYEYLDLKDIIPGKQYTLEELIDTCIYLIKYKYS